jgi:hypothetical protein
MCWLKKYLRRRWPASGRDAPRGAAESWPGDPPPADTIDLERSIARRNRAASRDGDAGPDDPPR